MLRLPLQCQNTRRPQILENTEPPQPHMPPQRSIILDREIWGFPKIRGTLFGVLIIRILLFRVLY